MGLLNIGRLYVNIVKISTIANYAVYSKYQLFKKELDILQDTNKPKHVMSSLTDKLGHVRSCYYNIIDSKYLQILFMMVSTERSN